MPRVKATAAVQPPLTRADVPVVIKCPACACEISSDGKKLITRSGKIEDWSFLEATLDKVEERLKDAEAKITTLTREKSELEEKLKNVGKQNERKSEPEPATGSGGGSWYKRKS